MPSQTKPLLKVHFSFGARLHCRRKNILSRAIFPRFCDDVTAGVKSRPLPVSDIFQLGVILINYVK